MAGFVAASAGTAQSGDLKHPDWHAESRILVSEGSCHGDVGLYLIDTTTGTTSLLYDSRDTDGYPRWFSDGKRIAFHRISKRRESQIYVGDVSSDGQMSNVMAVTEGPFDIEAAPSPDATRLVYSVLGRRGQDIAFLDFRSNRRKVWETEIAENYPSWHPDGDSFFFHALEEEQTHIHRRLLSTYQIIDITSGGSPNLTAHASPDGKRLVFVSERSGDREIYLRNLDGEVDVRLTNRPGRDGYPKFSPDGLRIAYHSEIEGAGFVVIVMDLDAEESRVFRCPPTSGPDDP